MGLKRKFKPHFLLGQFGRGGQWDCKSHGVGSIPTLTSVFIVLMVSTSVCGTDSMGSNPIKHPILECSLNG